jgi:hypothetical protein
MPLTVAARCHDRRVAKWCIGIALAVGLAGCGGTAGALDGSAAGRLHAGVAAVRAAEAKGDHAGALAALDRLSTAVGASTGLPAGDERTLKTGISRLRRRLQAAQATPTPAPAPAVTQTPTAIPTAAAPPPAPAKPGKGHGKPEKAHGHGKGGD